jgi:hypothetical protein
MATVITIKNTQNEVVADISSKEVLKDVVSTALIGRGAESYIEDFNQNFIKILENLANTVPPENPLDGQMWFDKKTNTLKLFNGSAWGFNVSKIGGKGIQDIKTWVLGYVDLSDKFDKAGGTITGEVTTKAKFSTSGNIVPDKNESYDLGSYTNRFKTLFIRDKSIYLGDKGKYHITKNSFIYTVTSNEDDVSKIPTGVIILNSSTGVAVVKRSIGKFDQTNAKFGQLIYDINNAVRLGRRISGFLGDRGVYSGGWSCGGSTGGTFNYVQLSTPMNWRLFGNSSTIRLSPIGVTGGPRGLWHTGGWPGWNWSSAMEYVIFSTPGNSNYFGNAEYRSVEAQGVSDGIRGVFSGGWNGWWWGRSDIDYVTISTPSNSRYFGSVSYPRYHSNTHISDGSKGVNAGGINGWWWWNVMSQMDYVTIATPSNSTYFGGMNWQRWCNSGNTDGVRGFVFGGWWCPAGAIEVLTISTPGNTSYFGNVGGYHAHTCGAGNGTSITVAGGWGYGWCSYNQLRRFETYTPSNANYFGSMGYHQMHHDATSGN